MKLLLFIFLVLVLIIGGCVNIVKQKGCTKEARVCSDGTSVGRNPSNNCEFDPCPKINDYINCNINKDNQKTFCIQVYEPVCGVDCKTYSNSCVACQSVNKYKLGECK